MSNKYGQKFADSSKKYATDALKTASKRAIQKTAEITGDLVGNKISDKITSYSKKFYILQHSCVQMNLIIKYQKKIYISARKTKNY